MLHDSDEVEGLAFFDKVGVDRCVEARIVELDREIVLAVKVIAPAVAPTTIAMTGPEPL